MGWSSLDVRVMPTLGLLSVDLQLVRRQYGGLKVLMTARMYHIPQQKRVEKAFTGKASTKTPQEKVGPLSSTVVLLLC